MTLNLFRRCLLPVLAVLFCMCGSHANGQKETSNGKIDEWRKAAKQGNAEAQFNLGLCYTKGEGVAKDEVEAAKLYRKAAEQGNIPAQLRLGVSYFSGEGVPKNFAEAVKWFRKAAEQGNASAQMNLVALNGAGEGVVTNDVEAYKWALLAAAQGMNLAKSIIPRLERDLSPAQRAEGQRLASEWQTEFKKTHPAK